jgi:hypothetical protein
LRRLAAAAALAALTAFGVSAPAAAAVPVSNAKVVIIVGATEGTTSTYRSYADQAYAEAIKYTSRVTKVYSPNATWSKVKAAVAGANIVLYYGHGNGWPSPYAPFSTSSKDGMGLNATYGAGNSNTKYFGEYYMAKLGLAANAVVILNRLCYASGNNEWGAGNPTRSVAIQRVDNFGTGFLRGGAKAVFASGITNVAYVLRGLFRGSSSMTMSQLFWSDPHATRSYRFSFNGIRNPGTSALMDPYAPSRYYRSVIGYLGTTVGAWRAGS